MFPGENEKLITTSILAFILGVVAAALTGYYLDVGFDGLLSALATLVAAFSGAWFAFYLNNKNKTEREKRKRMLALNLAIFTLMRQRNAAENMWNSFHAHPTDSSLAFEMPALKVNDYERIKQDLSSLAFLSAGKGVNVLLELTVEEERFEQMMFAIRQKHQHTVDNVMPEMMAAGLTDRPVTIADIKAGISDKAFVGALQAAKQARDEVGAFRASAMEMHRKLRSLAKDLFPDGRFIDYET